MVIEIDILSIKSTRAVIFFTRKLQKSQCVSSPVMDFGIIAAMDQNRIIGVNGSLPFDIPEDRRHFVNVTRGKILIVGKNTYHERDNFSHLKHCRHVIAVSSSMTDGDLKRAKEHIAETEVHLVKSFNRALELSTNLRRRDEESGSGGTEAEEIYCWIGGGQRIYEEAIRHRNAVELQLTMVNVETHQGEEFGSEVALFPAKYRYDNTFEEVKEMRRGIFHVYRRKKKRV